MYAKKSVITSLFVIWLALLTAGCQSLLEQLDANRAETSDTGRIHSTFVEARESLPVAVGQEIRIESYHVSQDKLALLEISVNGQKIRTEASSADGNTFSPNLASVKVLIDDQAVITNSAAPKMPTSAWTVSLLWTGHVPGTYDLSLVATDMTEHKSIPIVQRIEVE